MTFLRSAQPRVIVSKARANVGFFGLYASEAIVLVLRYFFEELRYQKVTVTVYSFNAPSIRLHESLGFQREGCLRRTVFTQGQHFDEIFFGMTVEEFRARYAGPST